MSYVITMRTTSGVTSEGRVCEEEFAPGDYPDAVAFPGPGILLGGVWPAMTPGLHGVSRVALKF